MVNFLTVFIQVIAGNVVSTIAVVVADELCLVPASAQV